jgi:hypothetical protein
VRISLRAACNHRVNGPDAGTFRHYRDRMLRRGLISLAGSAGFVIPRARKLPDGRIMPGSAPAFDRPCRSVLCVPAEIDPARRQIAAHAEAVAAGQGVAVVDGKIVENLHIVTARATLARAGAIAALEARQGAA